MCVLTVPVCVCVGQWPTCDSENFFTNKLDYGASIEKESLNRTIKGRNGGSGKWEYVGEGFYDFF